MRNAGTYWHNGSILKNRYYFANKGPSSQSYGFSSSHVWMCKLDYEESWVPKNWCFWTVVLEKTLESPLDWREIQLVHPKGNQSWILIGRTDVETETPILWLPDVRNWLIWEDPDARKDWRLEEKGMKGWDGWMASLIQWTWVWGNSGDRGGQRSLACCSPRSFRESDMTQQMNNSNSDVGWIS